MTEILNEDKNQLGSKTKKFLLAGVMLGFLFSGASAKNAIADGNANMSTADQNHVVSENIYNATNSLGLLLKINKDEHLSSEDKNQLKIALLNEVEKINNQKSKSDNIATNNDETSKFTAEAVDILGIVNKINKNETLSKDDRSEAAKIIESQIDNLLNPNKTIQNDTALINSIINRSGMRN